MKDGNWRPLSKHLVKYLPKCRSYTKLEAAFCLQCDYDGHNEVTISGYSALWQWSRKKVSLFLGQMGIDIKYPENTKKVKNQKGHIRVHKRDIKGTYKGHIRFIDFNSLEYEENIKGTYKGPIRDIKGSTTIDTNLKPKPKVPAKKQFLEFVFLTDDEHRKLIEKFGDSTQDWIKRLNNGIGSKGYEYKSHYHTILTWHRKDKEKKEAIDDKYDF